MARSDDPAEFDPHPGDPWHPSWETDDPAAEDEETLLDENSSVEDVFDELRRLDDPADAATEPVLADVAPLQTGGEQPTGDVAVEWDTQNVEEERRMEAAAGVFAGEALRSIESELTQSEESTESSAVDDEESRLIEQVEHAHGDWVHDEMVDLAAEMKADETEGAGSAAEGESTRRTEQVETAWSEEVADESRGVEATFADFEAYREGAEQAAEDQRMEHESDVAERSWVNDEMHGLEDQLATSDAEIESDAADSEADRHYEQVETVSSEQAANEIAAAVEALSEVEDGITEAHAAAEAARAKDQTSSAERDLTHEELVDLEEDLAAAALDHEDHDAAAEDDRSSGQVEAAQADDAAAASRVDEATLEEFESYRTDVETDEEDVRRHQAVEGAELDEFESDIEAVEVGLTDTARDAEAGDAADEEYRRTEQIEEAASDEAAVDAGQFAADVDKTLRAATDSEAAEEQARVDDQLELAAAEEFAIGMEAAELDLRDDDEDAEIDAGATEAVRFELQKAGAAVIEASVNEGEAAERHAAEERRLASVGEIEEELALKVELERVDGAAEALVTEDEGEVAAFMATVSSGAAVSDVAQSRPGWLRRLFGRRRSQDAAEDSSEATPGDAELSEGEHRDGHEDLDELPEVAMADDGDETFEESAVVGETADAAMDDPSSDGEEAESEPGDGESAPDDGEDAESEPGDGESAPDDGVGPQEEADKPPADESDGSPTSWEDPLAAAGYDLDDEGEEQPATLDGLEIAEPADATAEDEPLNDPEEQLDMPDFGSLTSEQYLQTTTEEFEGLAAHMAKAAEEDTGELAAVAAAIPGLDTGVVGLDDVVAAEGADDEVVAPRRGSDLAARIGTALGLLALFLGSLLFPLTIGLLVLVVLFTAAFEFYASVIRQGFRPMSLVGFLGVLGAFVGTWIWGVGAIPISAALTLVASALVLGLGPQRPRSLENLGLTIGVMVWIGGFGGFAFAMVDSVNYRWLITAVVITTAAMDVVQYFVGKRIGRHQMAPQVSPKKTIEGLVGGIFAALLVGLGWGFFGPFDVASGLALGAVVAIVSPFGDLAVSVVKRGLGVKDMGTVLPGHGGLLDRVDAMIFAIPAAWIVFRAAGIL